MGGMGVGWVCMWAAWVLGRYACGRHGCWVGMHVGGMGVGWAQCGSRICGLSAVKLPRVLGVCPCAQVCMHEYATTGCGLVCVCVCVCVWRGGLVLERGAHVCLN